MTLDQQQLVQYSTNGLVFLPGLLERSEIDALKDEQKRILNLDLEAHLRAEGGEFLGTAAMHRVSGLYSRLLCDERLLGIAEQLLGRPLYCHQYKIILKEPLGRLSLPWHQDYGPWLHHDGMPTPRALSIGIYLDEVTEFNGPIMYIPKSHSAGLLDFEVLEVPGTTPIPSLPSAIVSELAQKNGIVAPKGPPGSLVVFDCQTAHASGPNMSPWPRNLIYLSYNRLDNAIQRFGRPEHFASREFVPLKSEPREVLLQGEGRRLGSSGLRDS